jgi:hypothetical protein
MGYCTVEDVKKICNTKRTDAEISDLIDIASQRVNHDIQIYVYKELISSISNVKLNTIDGTNTDFYTQNWPLGDYDDDYDVDTTDIEMWAEEGNTETQLTDVSSVTASEGKIVMTSAPSSGSILRITYCYLPRHIRLSNNLIKWATAYLTAFMCQSKIPAELAKSYTIDRLKIVKTSEDVHVYWNAYQDYLNQIRSGTGNIEVAEVE